MYPTTNESPESMSAWRALLIRFENTCDNCAASAMTAKGGVNYGRVQIRNLVNRSV